MSKKSISICVIAGFASTCFILVLIHLFSYLSVYQGRITIGQFLARYNLLSPLENICIQGAVFLPLVLLFRRILRLHWGFRLGIILTALFIPGILSYISSTLMNLSINFAVNQQLILVPHVLGTILRLIGAAVSTTVLVAAAFGIGLIRREEKPQPTPGVLS